MPKKLAESRADDQNSKDYERAILLIQSQVQLHWLIFGAFQLSETVLLGGILTIMKDEFSIIVLVSSIFGIVLCIPWWTTTLYNQAFYQLRINEAKSFEPAAGTFFLDGETLFAGKKVLDVKIPKYAIWLRPRNSVRILVILFFFAFLGVIYLNFSPSSINIVTKASHGGNIVKTPTEFLASADLLANIVGGIVAAVVLGFIAWLWRQYREWRVRQLGDLMGRIIEHRNAGRHRVPDPKVWVQKAKELEEDAVKKAGKVSTASGILIEWLGEFPNFDVDAKVKNPDQKHYVSLLTAVISRIRDTSNDTISKCRTV
jgi:hypothetical protein